MKWNEDLESGYRGDTTNTERINFGNSRGGNLLAKLEKSSADIEVSYWMREIYNGLSNPILFFGELSDFSDEYLIQEFVFQILEKKLRRVGTRLFLDGLPHFGGTRFQRLFRETLNTI